MADYVSIRTSTGQIKKLKRSLAEDAIRRGTADFTIVEATKVVIQEPVIKKKDVVEKSKRKGVKGE